MDILQREELLGHYGVVMRSQSWARGKDAQLDKIDEDETRAIEDEFRDKTITALENKVKEHNEEHGSAKSKELL